MSAPNLTQPLRDAVVGDPGITALLASYKGSPAVFTRRPIPDDVDYPVICISPDVTINDEDGINDYRPLIMRDVIVYGSNERPGDIRVVNQIAFLLYNLFHRQRLAITVVDWAVVDIIADGPIVVPIEDQIVARAVPLLIKVAQLRVDDDVVVAPSHLLLSDGSDLLLTDGGLLLLATG